MSTADDLRKALEKAEALLIAVKIPPGDRQYRPVWANLRDEALTAIRECLAASSPEQEQRGDTVTIQRREYEEFRRMELMLTHPGDWQLVPHDPTDPMLATLAELAPHHVQPHILRRIYGQMLAASPSPKQSPESGTGETEEWREIRDGYFALYVGGAQVGTVRRYYGGWAAMLPDRIPDPTYPTCEEAQADVMAAIRTASPSPAPGGVRATADDTGLSGVEVALAEVLQAQAGKDWALELNYSFNREHEFMWNFRIKDYGAAVEEGAVPSVYWGTNYDGPSAIRTGLNKALSLMGEKPKSDGSPK